MPTCNCAAVRLVFGVDFITHYLFGLVGAFRSYSTSKWISKVFRKPLLGEQDKQIPRGLLVDLWLYTMRYHFTRFQLSWPAHKEFYLLKRRQQTLQTCIRTFTFLRFVGQRSAANSFSNSNNHFLAPLVVGAHFKISTASYHVHAEQIFTAVRLWNPAYIALRTPFIACLVIRPAAVNPHTAIEIKKSPETH